MAYHDNEFHAAVTSLTLNAKHYANTGRGLQFLREAIARAEAALLAELEKEAANAHGTR